MDFRLKGQKSKQKDVAYKSFNPCSNGLSAQSVFGTIINEIVLLVSILVLMDFRLKEHGATSFPDRVFGFQSLF